MKEQKEAAVKFEFLLNKFKTSPYYEEGVIINPFGKTFNNIDSKDLYKSVKTKTLLENSKRYQEEKSLSL